MTVVVDKTPAYQADLLPGDIILAIDDSPVSDVESAGNELSARAGQAVNVSIYRNGIRLVKTVQTRK